MTQNSGSNLGPMLEDIGRTYRPVELGRLVGLSASQIRNYERLGFIPRLAAPLPDTASSTSSMPPQ